MVPSLYQHITNNMYGLVCRQRCNFGQCSYRTKSHCKSSHGFILNIG